MSNLFAQDALVVPFENLRMSDVETVGGKNASLGEMISQLPTGANGVRTWLIGQGIRIQIVRVRHRKRSVG